ncbi:MAG: hypothetical protein JO354_04655 [Verrucomicrobia bacterium]|nr:hypothetical protein [Verrucomicrobiota bacterium]
MKRRQLLVLSNVPKFFFALLALFLTNRQVPGQTPDVTAAREIAKTDGEFSDWSRQKGTPSAWLHYVAEEGVIFAPGPVNAKKYWAGHSSFAGVLVWQPVFAAAAYSADLGYSAGVWELNPGGGKSTRSFGNYVTIWRKQATSRWKVAVDAGTQNAEPGESPPPVQILPADVTAGQRPDDEARAGFTQACHEFADEAKEDCGKAVTSHAANEIRVYRDHAAPAIGLAAARILLEPDHGRVSFEEPHVTFSKAADLACTYGTYSEERGNIAGRGSYLSIWRIDLNGDWKLVLELEKELPSTKQ